MAKTKKSKKTRKKYPERAKDVPVTQAMLFEVRDGLGARIDQNTHELGKLNSRIDQNTHELSKLNARIDENTHEIKKMRAEMKEEFHEIKLLVEEQNARNRIVLDGLTSLFARQERIEKKLG